MKPITIAESMANLRSQLDNIEQSSVQPAPIKTPISSLQNHMNIINEEIVMEAGERTVWNALRGFIQKPAIGQKAAKSAELRDPSGAVRGAHSNWNAPTPGELASNKAGQIVGKATLGAAVSGALLYGGWVANDWWNSLNGKIPPKSEITKPDGGNAAKPKSPMDPYILTLQRVLNLRYNAGLVEDGYWGPKTQTAFDQYMNVDQTKLKTKPADKSETDKLKSDELKVDKLPDEVVNQPPKGQGSKPADNAAPVTPEQPKANSAKQNVAPVLSQQEQATAEIKQLLQQLNATKSELLNDPEAREELQNIDRQYQF